MEDCGVFLYHSTTTVPILRVTSLKYIQAHCMVKQFSSGYILYVECKSFSLTLLIITVSKSARHLISILVIPVKASFPNKGTLRGHLQCACAFGLPVSGNMAAPVDLELKKVKLNKLTAALIPCTETLHFCRITELEQKLYIRVKRAGLETCTAELILYKNSDVVQVAS